MKCINRRIASRLATGFVIGTYLALRILVTIPAANQPAPLDDTKVFVSMADAPVLSMTMLAGLRPPVIPLVYKLFGSNFGAIIFFQTILSAICWVFLAWIVVGFFRKRLAGYGCFLLIMFAGMSWPVTIWESSLLSESISISLMVAVMGAWLLFVRYPCWYSLLFCGCCSILWIFCRETNTWLAFVFALAGLLVATVRKNRKLLFFSIIVAAAFCTSQVSSDKGKRWMFPLLNVVSQRILTDSTRTSFFVAGGMPVSAALLDMRNKWASSDNYAYYYNPGLQSFRDWLAVKGKRTYLYWMVAHPATTLREPLEHLGAMVASGIMPWYGSPGSRHLLPDALSKAIFSIGYERHFSLMVVWLLILCTGIIIGAQWWRDNNLAAFCVILVFLAYPHLLIVWHGDAMEVARHSSMVQIQLNVAWWIIVCLFFDRCRFSRFRFWKSPWK